MKVYIAAPFFTAGELAVVRQIEDILRELSIRFFSPRSLGRPTTEEERQHVFDTNAENIDDSDLVLAWVERKLDDGCEVRLMKPFPPFGSAPGVLVRTRPDLPLVTPTTSDGISWAYECMPGPLMQPDLGTVWEIGYAHSIHKPVIAFVETSEIATKLNLMLTQSMQGLIIGFAELKDRLQRSPSANHLIRLARTLGGGRFMEQEDEQHGKRKERQGSLTFADSEASSVESTRPE